MRIGLVTELFSHSSEAIMWRHLAREWINSGHEVFIKINDRNYLPKDVTGVSKNFPEVCLRISNQDPGNLDVFFNFFDLFNQNQKYWNAKIQSGIFSWGLLPMDPSLLEEKGNPYFVTGSATYNSLKDRKNIYPFPSGVDHSIFRPVVKHIFLSIQTGEPKVEIVNLEGKQFYNVIQDKNQFLVTITNIFQKIARSVTTEDFLLIPGSS